MNIVFTYTWSEVYPATAKGPKLTKFRKWLEEAHDGLSREKIKFATKTVAELQALAPSSSDGDAYLCSNGAAGSGPVLCWIDTSQSPVVFIRADTLTAISAS